MKKLVALLLIFGAVQMFAKPFSGGEEMVEKFLQSGSYIKIVDYYSSKYFPKSDTGYIKVEENSLNINGSYYYINEYSISLDTNNNIIIKIK